ncbi:SIS domain-containing protein [bacterium]|nr:SIS domain-containing protein [bacterium]
MKSDKAFVQERIQSNIAAKTKLMEQQSAEILAIGHKLVNVLRGGGKIFFCGNGGSAADAQHLAAELVCKLRDDRPPLAGLALTTDTSTLTATSNDYSFRDVFARQVIALGASGDALVGISSSGNSANVLAAIEAAKQKNILTVGLLGRDGGAIAGAVDQSVIVPDHDTQRIQECHILVGHIWMEMIEHELFG